jgi:hypothetical protein
MTTSIIRMLLAMLKFFVFNAGLNGDNPTYSKTSELLVAPSGRDYVHSRHMFSRWAPVRRYRNPI